MSTLLHQLILESSVRAPDSPAVGFKGSELSYHELKDNILSIAEGLINVGLNKNDRVAIYLPKQFETVISFFSTSQAGGVFVPLNPLLKNQQVEYILQDSGARILITNNQRLKALLPNLKKCPELETIISVDSVESNEINFLPSHIRFYNWGQLISIYDNNKTFHATTETDMASILYTSGSTGKPKGVVLSHLNMVSGAKSVTLYLKNTNQDRLLAILPFSFDYGLSQLTTAFYCGASVVLLDYMFPVDITRTIEQEAITGLAAVPTLWMQLKELSWSDDVKNRLRYITNSGGVLPVNIIENIRAQLPATEVFLMYGFTEAFRSTYLPPAQIDHRPESIGKAIPNAEIIVVNEHGQPCKPGEPGELVHIGPHVAIEYWKDPKNSAKCFRPAPEHLNEQSPKSKAAWSGDTVRMDKEGYMYFIGRKDDMIKTSGYRVSPTEIEEVIHTTGLANEVVVLGVPHATLGQAILVLITVDEGNPYCIEQIKYACKKILPNYMLPQHIEIVKQIPQNENGKFDRQILSKKYLSHFRQKINRQQLGTSK